MDEVRHPQKMWIMIVVWPLTALYFSVVTLWVYFRVGSRMAQDADKSLSMEDMKSTMRGRGSRAAVTRRGNNLPSPPLMVEADCVLGDLIAEFSIFGLGLMLLGQPIYAEYVGDLVLAWLFGIVFQYFAIKPMRNLSPGQGVYSGNQVRYASYLDV